MSDPDDSVPESPNIEELLAGLQREFAAGEIDFIAVVSIHPNGGSTRRLAGSANLTTVVGAIEAAKALVLEELLAECETNNGDLH
jgi:hypothetical protein